MPEIFWIDNLRLLLFIDYSYIQKRDFNITIYVILKNS